MTDSLIDLFMFKDLHDLEKKKLAKPFNVS
jgi:hypothetical protein